MKTKTTLFCILVMCSYVVYLTQYESKVLVKDSRSSTNTVRQETEPLKNKTLEINNENHKNLNDVSTIAELEKKFQGLTEKELEVRIERNNKMAKDMSLFQLANSGKLDASLNKIIVEYIRVNSVLNQILLDKRIEELEKDIL